jgi:hypothetical protein
MGQTIAVRRDFTSEEVRQLAKRAKEALRAQIARCRHRHKNDQCNESRS